VKKKKEPKALGKGKKDHLFQNCARWDEKDGANEERSDL